MAQARVLLIDDERNLLVGLAAVMKRAGFLVHTANSGEEGYEIAKQLIPDVIVSDVMMPPPNGFELRNMMAKDPKTAGIPFIFLTARVAQADKLYGLQTGADDYITKPFDRDELVARVKAVLRREAIGKIKARLQ